MTIGFLNQEYTKQKQTHLSQTAKEAQIHPCYISLTLALQKAKLRVDHMPVKASANGVKLQSKRFCWTGHSTKILQIH